MFVIPENLIQNVEIVDVNTGANIEDPNFPAINMIDEHPQKLAKATSNICKVRATNIEWLGGFAIINVACTYIKDITVKDSDGNVFYYEESKQMLTAGSYYNYYHAITKSSDRYYVIFDGAYSNVTLEFTLEYPPAQKAFIGLLMGGILFQIGQAEWGLSDNIKDMSIVKETLNGSVIVIKRNILRNKNYKVFATKGQYERFQDLYKNYRDKFWLFIPAKDLGFQESFLRYGTINKLPNIPQENKNFLEYNFEVQEVI